MMIQRRTKPHVSTAKAKPGDAAEKRDRAAHRKSVESVDHWSFLDEIEAPMWVDLNVEATSRYKDNDDDWFHVSHPFHQCSSRKLISSLSHAGVAKAKGTSSPNIPPSVSKSRGKDFKSKDWNKGNFGIIASNQHPIRNLDGSGPKLKLKPSDDNVGKTGKLKVSSSKATSTGKSSLTESTTCSSTITFESNERQKLKFSEVSNRTFGPTSGLLSTLKITQRKSCVTRQALRVERQSNSGKSSVGSSSHPYCDDKNATVATPESRNVGTILFGNRDKAILVTKAKESKPESLATRCGSKTGTIKSAHEEAAKSKVANAFNSKATRLRRGKEPLAAVTNTNCKIEAKGYNRLAMGKENANIRVPAGGGAVAHQIYKVKKPKAPLKIDKPGLIGPKVKIFNQGENKSSSGITRNIHFR